jgi:hypothetical protein
MLDRNKSQQKDFRIIISGANGNGKSSLSCCLGEIHNPLKFREDIIYAVNNQINFTAKTWIHAINLLKFYEVNIYDEPFQSGGNHREFMTDANMVVSKTLSTARFKKLIIPINIPFIDMLDKDLRKLCQIFINCFDQGKAEVFKILTPKFGGEPWYEKIVDRFTWDMPGNELWKVYNDKKIMIETGLYDEYESELIKKEKAKISDSELINKINSNKDLFMHDKKEKIDVYKVMGEFEIGRDRATRIIRNSKIEK